MATATVTSAAFTSALGADGVPTPIVNSTFTTDDGDSGTVTVPAAGDWAGAVNGAVADDLAGYILIRQQVAGVDSIGQTARFLASGTSQPIVVVHVATDNGLSFNVQAAKTGDWPAQLISQAQAQLAAYAQLTGA